MDEIQQTIESQIKKLDSMVSDLSNANEHLDQIAAHIKSCDPEWMDSSCDRPAIFGLMGHKGYVDEKIHEIRLEIESLKAGLINNAMEK